MSVREVLIVRSTDTPAITMRGADVSLPASTQHTPHPGKQTCTVHVCALMPSYPNPTRRLFPYTSLFYLYVGVVPCPDGPHGRWFIAGVALCAVLKVRVWPTRAVDADVAWCWTGSSRKTYQQQQQHLQLHACMVNNIVQTAAQGVSHADHGTAVTPTKTFHKKTDEQPCCMCVCGSKLTPLLLERQVL